MIVFQGGGDERGYRNIYTGTVKYPRGPSIYRYDTYLEDLDWGLEVPTSPAVSSTVPVLV
jgi:hypothetical protein